MFSRVCFWLDFCCQTIDIVIIGYSLSHTVLQEVHPVRAACINRWYGYDLVEDVLIRNSSVLVYHDRHMISILRRAAPWNLCPILLLLCRRQRVMACSHATIHWASWEVLSPLQAADVTSRLDQPLGRRTYDWLWSWKLIRWCCFLVASLGCFVQPCLSLSFGNGWLLLVFGRLLFESSSLLRAKMDEIDVFGFGLRL